MHPFHASIFFLITILAGCRTTAGDGNSSLAAVTRFPGPTSEPSSVVPIPGASDGFLTSTWAGDVVRWSLVTQRAAWTESYTEKINHIATSADGKFVYVAGAKGLVRILQASDGEEIKKLDQPARGSAIRLGASPDGRKLAVVFLDQSLVIYDVDQGVVIQTLTDIFRWPSIKALDFSTDSNRLLLADLVSAKEIDLIQGTVLRTFRDERHCEKNKCIPWLSAATISEDRRLIAFGSMNEVRLYDSESGRELVTLGSHPGEVSNLRFLDNSRKLESIGLDGSSMSWSIPGLDLLSMHTTQHPRLWQTSVTADNKFIIGVDRVNFDITISTFDDTADTYGVAGNKWEGKLRIDSRDTGSIRIWRDTVSNQDVACAIDTSQQCSATQYCFVCTNRVKVFMDEKSQLGRMFFYERLSNGQVVEVSMRCTLDNSGANTTKLYECIEASSIQ
jgi:WD40 repeat protein